MSDAAGLSPIGTSGIPEKADKRPTNRSQVNRRVSVLGHGLMGWSIGSRYALSGPPLVSRNHLGPLGSWLEGPVIAEDLDHSLVSMGWQPLGVMIDKTYLNTWHNDCVPSGAMVSSDSVHLSNPEHQAAWRMPELLHVLLEYMSAAESLDSASSLVRRPFGRSRNRAVSCQEQMLGWFWRGCHVLGRWLERAGGGYIIQKERDYSDLGKHEGRSPSRLRRVGTRHGNTS